MVTTPNDIRNYAAVDTPHSNLSKIGSVNNVACSSATNSTQSVAEACPSSCLSGKDNVQSTCSYTDTSVATICTNNRCKEEIVHEMFAFLEEKISHALTDCNMNVQEAINKILGETGSV